jgi:glycosyltransferase involved in cell wall biosynthesis
MEQSENPIDFSLLLPVYNAESFLIDTLKSISEIEYSAFEVIIINDGSTDSSKGICLDFCKKFSNFKFYENEKNIGLIKTLNKGLLLANGKYIVRVDSDDLFNKSILKEYSKKIKRLDANTNFILTSKSYYIKGKKIVKPIFRYSVKSENIKKIIFLENQINHPSSCFPNYKKNNILYGDEENVKYFEDSDLWIRMVAKGYEIVSTNDVYLYYRVHDESVTKKFNFEKSILKERYLLKSELKYFFNLNEISLISGKNEIRDLSFFSFERNLNKYLKSKRKDLDLRAWLLFYFLNLYKKIYKNISFIKKINLSFIIIKHLIYSLFNIYFYRHFWK